MRTMKPLDATGLKRLHRTWRRSTDQRISLLLDKVNGPYNVGAILRTAAALHIETIYAIGMEVGWTDVKVQKTAMGTHRFVETVNLEDAAAAVAAVREAGYRLVGLELVEGAQPLWAADLASDICIAVGHEDRGVSPAVLRECDEVGFIPQYGRVGSLNVATATSIACYEARRQAAVQAGTEVAGTEA